MSGVLTRLAGRLRTGDLVTGISRLLALACLVGLVGMLPWLSGKDPALTILRATSSDREPTPEVLASIRKSIGIDGGPLHVIGHWLAGVARGDLGRSWVSGADVGPDAVDAFGVSLSLMAAALGVTPAQIVIRWHLQHGLVVIPKTTHRERMVTNADVFSFALSDGQMAALDALDRGLRTGSHPDTVQRQM